MNELRRKHKLQYEYGYNSAMSRSTDERKAFLFCEGGYEESESEPNRAYWTGARDCIIELYKPRIGGINEV